MGWNHQLVVCLYRCLLLFPRGVIFSISMSVFGCFFFLWPWLKPSALVNPINSPPNTGQNGRMKRKRSRMPGTLTFFRWMKSWQPTRCQPLKRCGSFWLREHPLVSGLSLNNFWWIVHNLPASHWSRPSRENPSILFIEGVPLVEADPAGRCNKVTGSSSFLSGPLVDIGYGWWKYRSEGWIHPLEV